MPHKFHTWARNLLRKSLTSPRQVRKLSWNIDFTAPVGGNVAPEGHSWKNGTWIVKNIRTEIPKTPEELAELKRRPSSRKNVFMASIMAFPPVFSSHISSQRLHWELSTKWKLSPHNICNINIMEISPHALSSQSALYERCVRVHVCMVAYAYFSLNSQTAELSNSES